MTSQSIAVPLWLLWARVACVLLSLVGVAIHYNLRVKGRRKAKHAVVRFFVTAARENRLNQIRQAAVIVEQGMRWVYGSSLWRVIPISLSLSAAYRQRPLWWLRHSFPVGQTSARCLAFIRPGASGIQCGVRRQHELGSEDRSSARDSRAFTMAVARRVAAHFGVGQSLAATVQAIRMTIAGLGDANVKNGSHERVSRRGIPTAAPSSV
jgi:hypothetical protein